jgi:hypothetical protein
MTRKNLSIGLFISTFFLQGCTAELTSQSISATSSSVQNEDIAPQPIIIDSERIPSQERQTIKNEDSEMVSSNPNQQQENSSKKPKIDTTPVKKPVVVKTPPKNKDVAPNPEVTKPEKKETPKEQADTTDPKNTINPIVSEVERLTRGEYVLNSEQNRQIRRAQDPQEVADLLEHRVLGFRLLGAHLMHIPLNSFTVVDAMPGINLGFATKGYGHDPTKVAMSLDAFLYKLGSLNAFNLGKKIGSGRLNSDDFDFQTIKAKSFTELSADVQENPIVAEVNRLTRGEFKFTNEKIKEIGRAKDPSKVADYLEERVYSYRKLCAHLLKVDISNITPSMSVEASNLSSATRGYGDDPTKVALSLESLLSNLKTTKSFQIGYAIGSGEWR